MLPISAGLKRSHSSAPHGVFVVGRGDPLPFVELPVPTPEEIEALTARIAWRVTAQIERMVEAETEIGGRLDETAAALGEALARSLAVPASPDRLPGLDPERDHASGHR